MMESLIAVAVAAAVATIPAQHPETRATWLTTTANDAISTPAKTASTMARLRQIGLNTVYVECWKNGYTEFPSRTMNRLIGISQRVNGAPPELQRDLLGETLIEAHRNGLAHVAWFEYGFMAAFRDTDNELRRLAERRGWLTQTRDGQYVGKQNGFLWLNPLHPESQQLLTGIVLDAVRKYDLDGIQLDDRIAWPVEMGYDAYTRRIYAQEHAGKQPPANANDPEWIQWRAGKVSEYSRRLVAAIRKERPEILLSVSPAPYPWSLENYACDWPTWTRWDRRSGQTWDEYVPQTYAVTASATKAALDRQIEAIGGRKSDLISGIRIVGTGPNMTEADVFASICHGRERGIGGHSFWFSRGVLDLYAEPLRRFYGNWVPNPHIAPRRRFVASRTLTGWAVQVQNPGRYRVIGKFDGQWRELTSKPFALGGHRIEATGATAVELLEDRRPNR